MGVKPSQSQLLADPGRIGVDNLAQEQLRADGEDLAAHGLGRREVVERGAARAAGGVTPAVEEILGPTHQGQPHGHPQQGLAETRVVEPVAGSRINPTARSWAAVLHLASGRAGTEMPLRATTDR